MPERVTVEVPLVNMDDTPDVFQLPDTVHEPLVSVIVPFVPPVSVTFDTDTVDAFAVSIPPLPTLNAPPVKPRFAVESAVVEDESAILRVPPHFKGFVAIVNVCAVPALLVNVTFPPNS